MLSQSSRLVPMDYVTSGATPKLASFTNRQMIGKRKEYYLHVVRFISTFWSVFTDLLYNWQINTAVWFSCPVYQPIEPSLTDGHTPLLKEPSVLWLAVWLLISDRKAFELIPYPPPGCGLPRYEQQRSCLLYIAYCPSLQYRQFFYLAFLSSCQEWCRNWLTESYDSAVLRVIRKPSACTRA